jgi:hypothetical protein
MIPNEDFQAEMLSNIAEQLCCAYPGLDSAKAASIATGILERDERREAARKTTRITTELIRARQDCLIFFRLMEEGWGETKRLPSGAIVAENAPVSWDERLNFPKRSRQAAASKRVRQTCPGEAAQYKQALRDWREARRRYLATETEESWEWYRAGKGNRNSVAYRSKMDLNHQGGLGFFRTRRLFKYTLGELLPRLQERERANKEMREATARLIEMRDLIFARMGVPPAYRSYA